MKSKSAGLVVRNGILVLKDTDKIQVKSIDKRGNSVFTEEEKEVERPLTQRAMDERMEKYLKALELAGASFEDVQSKTNSRLMVRKYENLVFLPAEGEDVLYPNVSVMLAGLNPLNADALIRASSGSLGSFRLTTEACLPGTAPSLPRGRASSRPGTSFWRLGNALEYCLGCFRTSP